MKNALTVLGLIGSAAGAAAGIAAPLTASRAGRAIRAAAVGADSRDTPPSGLRLPAPTVRPTPAPPAGPNTLPPSEYIPASELHAGMKGYGLSVFHGNKIERFDVTILGLMRKINSGHDLILVRLGGPQMKRVSDVIAGMSGSPVYINGKIVGAVSYGMEFTKEPIGYLTPIADMLDAWDPALPQTPDNETPSAQTAGGTPTADRVVPLPTPFTIQGRTYRRLHFLAADAPVRREPAADTLTARPCLERVSVSGVSASRFPKVAEMLRKLGLDAHEGPGSTMNPELKGSALVPGGAIGMSLMTGDIDMTGIGTLTYRRGDRVVAFGHPFLGIGPVDAPMFTAYIHDLLPSYSESEKIGSAVRMVGSFSQDRPFSIGGRVGAKPTLVPVTVHVEDHSVGRDAVFHASTVRHPQLTSLLAPTAVGTAIDNVHGMPGDTMALVDTEVVADDVGAIRHSNRVYDPSDIGEAATADLQNMMGLLSSNRFYPVGVRSINVHVTIERGRHTAQVERIFLQQTRYEPGDTVAVGVVLKPYKQDPLYRTLHIKIPPTTPPGTLMLSVQGGAGGGALRFGGMTFTPPGSGESSAASIAQLAQKFQERDRNDDLIAHLSLPTTAISLGGERLSGLPPNIDSAMRSGTRTSGIQLERDDVKVTERTDFVLSGVQALPIRVVRRGQPDDLATPNGAAPNGYGIPTGGSGSIPVSPSGGGAGNSYGGAPGGSYSTGDSPAPMPAESATTDLSAAQPNTAFAPQHAPASGVGINNDTTETGAPLSAARRGADAASKIETGLAADLEADGNSSTPRLVGRAPGVWRQESALEFRRGTLEGLTVTSNGEIRIAPRLTRVSDTVEPYFWSLALGDNGLVYAGSGDHGAIYKINPATGASTVFAQTGELEVLSLVRGADGTLFAGTAPHGRIYRISADGKATLLYQSTEKYVLALALGGRVLYAATGGGTGRVYAVPIQNYEGKTLPAETLYSGDESSVTALALSPTDGSLYAGTAPNGLVVRVAGPMLEHPTVLYATRDSAVSGLAVTAGALFAATTARGELYRIDPAGAAAPRVLFDRPIGATGLYGLQAGTDGRLYFASGSTVIAVDPATDAIRTFEAASDIQILNLQSAPDGTIWASTGNTAGVYRLDVGGAGAPIGGQYLSDILDAQTTARWGVLRWNASLPTGSKLVFETRSGNTPQPDDSWSAWSRYYTIATGENVASPPARFLQYRATLSGTPSAHSGPALSGVEMYYLTANQPPQVTLFYPHGGEALRGTEQIRWSGTDPDRDTLSYTLSISSDGGATWRPLGEADALSSRAAAPGRLRDQSGRSDNGDLAAQLALHPEMSPELRARILADAPSTEITAASGPVSVPISPFGATTSPAATPASGTRTEYSLDTTTLPDGVYRVRITASDRPSNPTGALTDQKTSPEFRIANHPPSVVLFRSSTQQKPDHTVHLEGIALHPSVFIRGVQYRVDGGAWMAAAAADGIFDSSMELFTIDSPPLAPGPHEFEVQAEDEAGNSVTVRTRVR